MGVHHLGHFRVFEAFVFHHMAPVAGSIADADEQHFIQRLCLGEGFLVPGMPFHGIMGMLKQERTSFVNECVGEFQLFPQ